MTKDGFGLGPEELSILFPFHFIFDTHLVVLQVGPSSSEIFGITKGSTLSDHIKIKPPNITPSFSKISRLTDKNFLLESTRHSLILHGQMLLLENQEAIAFLGSPWITDSEQFHKSGLKLTHFAIHVPVIDYIFLLQAQKMSINDAKGMARKNQSINQQLEQANNELEEYSQNLEIKVKNRTEETKELVRLNRALQEAQEKAEKSSNAKSEFLSQMSHELRTPLNAILGFGQLMESDPKEPLTEYQQESVSEILKAGKHLLELINEILDLSRIETGHPTLSFENVNLNYLTEELATLCQPMARKNNIELLNYVPLHDDLFVYADRVRLKQVLLNLVSNAIKYNKASGSVKIDATGNKETGIRISVSDTGIGIPEDRLDDLFQPFNRLGSEKTDIEGTGIGLTITKQLVELMNGSIEVDSRPGEGSTFSVTLPWGQPEEESKVLRPMEAAHNPSSLTPRDRWVILYVEDNPANLNLVRQILRRRSDVLLLTAPEAKLGIELAQAHQPDLILLDINLPGMDGLTAFKRLRALKETKTTPVVAISANALPRDIKIALDTGFSDYLTKPLDVVEFNRTVEDHLQTRLQRKPSNS